MSENTVEKVEQPLLFDILKEKLLIQSREVSRQIEKKHRRLIKWLADQGYSWNDLRLQLGQVAVGASLAGALFLVPAPATSINNTRSPPPAAIQQNKEEQAMRLGDLLKNLSNDNFTANQASLIDNIQQVAGIKTAVEMDGIKLNINFGFMGAEQHLYRYPGDNLDSHLKNEDDRLMYGPSGVAPGLGAWGYWAQSKENFTPQMEQQERYYVAVETFLSPNWETDYKRMYDWFRYRKVMVINPKNGRTAIAVIGDAGPASWTGKVFGGSPELMHSLGLGDGPRKGETIILFVDDPDNKIPLGPQTDIKIPSVQAQEVRDVKNG